MMIQRLKTSLLLTTSLLLSTAIAPLEATAATFSLSLTDLKFTHFSHQPIFSETITDIFPFTDTTDGEADAIADAEAKFDDKAAKTELVAEVSGQGNNYFAGATAESRLLGDFLIPAGEVFSFKFSAVAELETSVEDVDFEFASAENEILFGIFDEFEQELGLFGFFGKLDIPGEESGSIAAYTDNFTVTEKIKEDLTGRSRSISAVFKGTFQYQFEQETLISLGNINSNTANVGAIRSLEPVAVPEDSFVPALGMVGLLFGLRLTRRQKQRSNAFTANLHR